MYEKFFHLQKSPFGLTPDPSCLMMTESHREALSGLLYAVHKRKGFVVLTGDAGTGKTTLIRALIRSAKTAKFSVVLNPTLSVTEFLELVLCDFGITEVPESKAQRIMKLQEFLVKLHNEGAPPVLIVDEAHKLSPEILEEIRLLTNFETAEKKLMHIVLAGQTELKALLNREDLRQLKQRIEIRLEIKPLSPGDVATYMRHRWERAGGATVLPFTSEAITLIASASRGIPRLVNSICDNALLLAFGEADSAVTAKHVREVLRDLDLGDNSPPPVERKSASPEPQRRSESEPQRRSENTAAFSAVETQPIRNLPSIERYIPSTPKPSLMRRVGSWLNIGNMRTVRTNSE
jgi:general secretion pathway protein A